MSNYVLTCCSTADMPLSYMKDRDIPFVCFHYNMDGKEYPDDLGVTMSFEEFYNRIANGALPTTSQVNVGQFVAFFRAVFEGGKGYFAYFPFLRSVWILQFSLSSQG